MPTAIPAPGATAVPAAVVAAFAVVLAVSFAVFLAVSFAVFLAVSFAAVFVVSPATFLPYHWQLSFPSFCQFLSCFYLLDTPLCFGCRFPSEKWRSPWSSSRNRTAYFICKISCLWHFLPAFHLLCNCSSRKCSRSSCYMKIGILRLDRSIGLPYISLKFWRFLFFLLCLMNGTLTIRLLFTCIIYLCTGNFRTTLYGVNVTALNLAFFGSCIWILAFS